jgi:hypothetical protein
MQQPYHNLTLLFGASIVQYVSLQPGQGSSANRVPRGIDRHDSGKEGERSYQNKCRIDVVRRREMYVEHIAREAADHLTDRIHVSDKLPLPVQKELAKVGRDSQHELKSSRTLTQTQLR